MPLRPCQRFPGGTDHGRSAIPHQPVRPGRRRDVDPRRPPQPATPELRPPAPRTDRGGAVRSFRGCPRPHLGGSPGGRGARTEATGRIHPCDSVLAARPGSDQRPLSPPQASGQRTSGAGGAEFALPRNGRLAEGPQEGTNATTQDSASRVPPLPQHHRKATAPLLMLPITIMAHRTRRPRGPAALSPGGARRARGRGIPPTARRSYRPLEMAVQGPAAQHPLRGVLRTRQIPQPLTAQPASVGSCSSFG